MIDLVPTLTASEAEARAMAEIQRLGLDVDASLVVADGRLRRFRTSADGSTDTAGWIVVHAGEWPCMLYGDWRQDSDKAGQQKIPLWDHADRSLTLEERRAFDAAMKRRKEAREAEKRKGYEAAAERARNDLAKAGPASPDHPYLQRKGIVPTPGVRQARIRHPKKPTDAPLEDALLVPLTNAEGVVRGYQRIYADGYKANMAGAEKLGTFHELPGQGPNSAFTVVCEGYATAASISRAAQGATVLSVCDKGNIGPVLAGLKAAGRLDPDRTLIVADNDWETARKGYLEAKAKGTLGDRAVADFNPGLQAAKAAAQAFGCRWTLAVPDEAIYPTGETATDANDLFLAKREDCLRAGMAPEEADRLAVDTVRGMLDRGWGVEDAPPAQEPQKPPMQFIPFGEAVKMTPPAELVKGLVPAVGVGQFFGDTGTFKTFVMLQVGLHVSEGWALAGRAVKRRPVVYLMLEGETGLSKRTRALDRWRLGLGRELTGSYMFWPRAFSLGGDEDARALVDSLRAYGLEGALVIVDTQSQASPGLDEDRARDMTLVLSRARYIAESIRGVVLLIHHTGKNAANGQRGSSAQKANLDFVLEARRLSDKRVAVTTAKEKDSPSNQMLAFDIRIVGVGEDEDGEPATSCVAVPVEGEVEMPKTSPLTPTLDRALDTLRDALRACGGTTVSLEDWRRVYYAKCTGSTPGSKRSMFNDVRKKLVEAGVADVEDDNYWIVGDGA